MARIRPPLPEELPAEVRDLLRKLPDLGHFRLLAHAHTSFGPRLAYGETLMRTLVLPDRVRELVILRAAALARCAYVLQQHEAAGLACGLTPAEIAAARRVDQVAHTVFGPADSAALRFTDEMIEQRGAGALAVEEAVRHFGERGLVEIGLVVDRYFGLSLLLNSLDVEAEGPQELVAVLEEQR